MEGLTGMKFHSCENEVERLEQENARLMSERDEARREADQVETQLRNRNADIADLRRQVAEAQARQVAHMRECDSLRGLLTGCREAIGAADNAQLLEMCEVAADLRRQLEHANRWRDNEIMNANEARQEAADLRKQRDAAIRGVEIREEILTRKTAEFKTRLQAEIDLRTLSTQDGEVDEFNAGYEACRAGQPIEAEPSELHFDVWRQGWMVADYERMSAETADLRRQVDAVPIDEIDDLYVAYAYAVSGWPEGKAQQFPQVGRWLRILPADDTPHGAEKGDA